jgi:Domain of unknown function (DUF4123)
MSTVQATLLSKEEIANKLRAHLFPEDEKFQTYAVLDGASVPELLDQLYGDEPPEFACLYRGELEPDLAEAAPYLIRLSVGSPFTEWLLSNCWGKHWGFFATAAEGIDGMRRHYRHFLMVKDPEGKQIYFRFYDPRVLRSFINIAEQEKISRIMGPAALLVLENKVTDGVTFLLHKADGSFAVSDCEWTALPDPLHLVVPPLANYGGRPDMVISSEEMDYFDEIAARDFIERARSHFIETFPEDDRVANPEQLGAFIETEIQAAAESGMELEHDVIRYLQLAFQLGADFPSRFTWAVAVFGDASLDATEKMDRLWEHATEQFEADAANP